MVDILVEILLNGSILMAMWKMTSTYVYSGFPVAMEALLIVESHENTRKFDETPMKNRNKSH